MAFELLSAVLVELIRSSSLVGNILELDADLGKSPTELSFLREICIGLGDPTSSDRLSGIKPFSNTLLFIIYNYNSRFC